jgi:hypothetical protein
MFAHSDIYFRLHLLLIIIHITCISLSLRRTSAPIHLTSVLGVLGTQETSCIVIVGLFERDSFDLLLPEFDKPWVVHLRETCCCSTNLCTWRPNTVYKNRSMRRHQSPSPSPSLAGPSPSSSPSPSPAAPSTSAAPVLHPHTCSHSGIFRPKERTDGTVAWHTACVTADGADPSSEPHTYQAAMSIPHWREAMEHEYHALLHSETWTLVPPPP